MELTRDEVQKIALLAKLDLTDAELEKYAGEITNILGYVSKLQEVDISDTDETSNLSDFEGKVLRADEPNSGIDADHITLNATDGRSEGTSFKTSKIVGGEE
jgi:aspartyl-tRNA(Asn)/glutamyl-tRNA(Gln) amidotransferase subunit C